VDAESHARFLKPQLHQDALMGFTGSLLTIAKTTKLSLGGGNDYEMCPGLYLAGCCLCRTGNSYPGIGNRCIFQGEILPSSTSSKSCPQHALPKRLGSRMARFRIGSLVQTTEQFRSFRHYILDDRRSISTRYLGALSSMNSTQYISGVVIRRFPMLPQSERGSVLLR
jgi:hypothetical protein